MAAIYVGANSFARALRYVRMNSHLRQYRLRIVCPAVLVTLLFSSCGGGAASTAANPVAMPKLGAISYWSVSTLYDQLPSGAIAVVNPSNGIFTGQTTTLTPDVASYAAIVSTAATRNVAMLGYVPTGYFSHACNIATQCQTWARIDAQVQAYFQNMSGLAGIFFDEASPTTWNCAAFVAEYQRLRDIVHLYNAHAKVAFNAAVPDTCVVDATAAGEIAVLFEGGLASYQNQATIVAAATASAVGKGVVSWHLVHSAATGSDLASAFAQASASKVTLFYATDKTPGANVWNSLPTYWQQELGLMGY